MKRILTHADELMDNAYGFYEDPEVTCGWYWDSQSQQIVDFVGMAECVVGYAKTLTEVLN